MEASARELAGSGAGARRRGRMVAVGTAVLAAAVVWLVARTALDQELIVEQPGREPVAVGIGQVLVFAIVPSLAGWALLAVLERFAAARARLAWTVVALVVLAVSILPILQVDATGATKITLVLLHVVVGAVLIPGLRRTAR